MKAAAQAKELGITQALMKDNCPICALLREFQNELIDTVAPGQVERLCSYHVWAIAHSTPARSAVGVFARLLDSVERQGSTESSCDVCSRLHQEEELRIRELAKELVGRISLRQWMVHHGGICLHHAAQLQKCLPVRLHSTVSRILQRYILELKQELEQYRQHLEQGLNIGGGILGRIAELLLSQRGITR
jgi:hypothetical protein